ncbi:hypothetical protein [Nocardiopsis nanhaiensis]
MPGPDDDFELFPDTTRDERAEGWGDGEDDSTARLIAERPPHWD